MRLGAARVGIADSTLRDWLSNDPVFQAEYEAARRATFQSQWPTR